MLRGKQKRKEKLCALWVSRLVVFISFLTLNPPNSLTLGLCPVSMYCMFDVFLQTGWTVYRSIGEDPPLHPTAFSCPFQWKASTKFLSTNYDNSDITNIGQYVSCFCLLFSWGDISDCSAATHNWPCSSFPGWDRVWKWLLRDRALSCSLSSGGLWRKSSLICSCSLVFFPPWESSCWSGSSHIYEEGHLQLAQTRLTDSAPPPTVGRVRTRSQRMMEEEEKCDLESWMPGGNETSVDQRLRKSWWRWARGGRGRPEYCQPSSRKVFEFREALWWLILIVYSAGFRISMEINPWTRLFNGG